MVAEHWDEMTVRAMASVQVWEVGYYQHKMNMSYIAISMVLFVFIPKPTLRCKRTKKGKKKNDSLNL